MSPENGIPRKSLISDGIALLEDQLELVGQELEYETTVGVRRLFALVVAGVFGVTGYVYLQVALCHGLVRLGLPAGWAYLLLGFLHALAAAGVFWVMGRRDPRAGPPFKASREELQRNLEWTRKLFS